MAILNNSLVNGDLRVTGTVYGNQAGNYGTCSTAAATTGKEVSIAGFLLTTGIHVFVKFTVTNTGAVASLTLNVNATGAKNIKYRGGNLPSAETLAANRVYEFVYDGTNWELVGDLDTNTQTVTYNSTTFNEIAALYQAGHRNLLCRLNNSSNDPIAPLTNVAISSGNPIEFIFTRSIVSDANSGYIIRYSCSSSSGWSTITGSPAIYNTSALANWNNLTTTGHYRIAAQSPNDPAPNAPGGATGTGEQGQMGCLVTRSTDNGYITQMALGDYPSYRASDLSGDFSNGIDWRYLVCSNTIHDIRVSSTVGNEPGVIYFT